MSLVTWRKPDCESCLDVYTTLKSDGRDTILVDLTEGGTTRIKIGNFTSYFGGDNLWHAISDDVTAHSIAGRHS